ncbi:MAG: hypothetical protein SNJ55_06435 [Chloroherpetonaceae bacterium]
MKFFSASLVLFVLFATPIYAQQFQASVLTGVGLAEGYLGGVSARAGYTFQNGIYVGGQFTHHFGEELALFSFESDDVFFGRINARYFGGEVGYDVMFSRFSFRPYASVGYLTEMSSFKQENTKLTISQTRAFYSGGTVLKWRVFERYHIGADFRALATWEFSGMLFSGFLTFGYDF